MNLPDLPTEIFAAIIHVHLRDGGGWAVAVQARYVCKTFAAAIHNDMFCRYSASYYRRFNADWKERLLGPNMHTVLSKMGPTRCNSTYILDHMDATVDFLMDFSFYKTQAQRVRYRLALCVTISAALCVDDILAYLCDGPYDDSIKVRKNMGRADTVGMLAAAAAVNSEPALRFLVGKVHDVGLRSELYSTPLTAAAVNGHFFSSAFIYDCLKNGVHKRNQLYNAIDICMFKQRAIILPTLMKWYLEYCHSGSLKRVAKEGWTDWAILKGELDVLRFCYDHEHGVRCQRRLEVTPFRLACEYGHAHVIQYLLEFDDTLRGAMRTGKKGFVGACELSEGLAAAAEHGWLVAAGLLILVQIYHSGRDRSFLGPVLWYAVKGGHVDIVVLLLAYGAAVPKKKRLKREGIWALAANQGWKMTSLIEEAWKAQLQQESKAKIASVN
jgi:hypothetical protein